MHRDKFGCYRVGDLKFHSKLEAIEMHAKTGIHPHWDFNEAVFSSYDWTVEPTENILELYRQRAQQLRDKYDYIVLCWGGGADCETARCAFHDNDILLDECVSWGNYDGSKLKNDFFNSELFFRAIPRANQLKDQHPETEFRILDLSQMTMDHFKDSKFKYDWIYNANMCLSPNAVVRDSIGYKVDKWRKIIDSGKNFCMLWGIDKPRVFHKSGKFFARFIDVFDSSVKTIAGKNFYADEFFFWTPDDPRLVIKQSHLIKNYLNNNLLTSPFVSEKPSQLACKQYNGKNYWLNTHGVHSVVYPNWDINTYDSGKPPSPIYSSRDTWFFDSESQNESRVYWQMGIDKIFDIVPDYWKNDPNDISRGLKACWSKSYFLE
jgi:hypothetical protein